MADLRVTRQVVEVVGSDPVATRLLRTTRQVVEVIAADPPSDGTYADAETTFAITQAASYNIAAVRSVSNGLSLADSATVNFSVGCSASNTLNLSAVAGVGIFVVSAENTLGFGVQATKVTTILAEASNSLSLAQQATGSPSRAVSASNTLPLADQAEGYNSTKHVAGQNGLTLGVNAHGNKVAHVTATTPIYFTETTLDRLTFDEIEIGHGIFVSAGVYVYVDPAPTGNILSFAQRAGAVHVRADGISVTATSALAIWQSGNPTPTGNAASQLTLGHSASATAGKASTNTLALDQQASRTIERFVSASSTLGLHQTVNVVLVEGCVGRSYTPFVGSTDDPDAPAPPPTTIPTLERVEGVQLYWPIDAPTMTVTLRGPELDNKDRLRFQRINRETRGGTLVVFADPIWPKVQQLTLEFVGLEEDEAQSLLTFITATLGKEIGLRDWENRHWAGVIISPDEPIIRNSPHNISTALEFEGVPV